MLSHHKLHITKTIISACMISASALVLMSCQASSNTKSVVSNPLSGLEHRAGFIDLYVDTKTNRVLAKLPKAADDGTALRFIHTARLTAGLGSNPVGLDRGWGQGGSVVVFRKFGDKVVLEKENLSYRANPDNPLEARAVKESFATSFIGTAKIVSQKDGLVVDLTDFLTRDILGLKQHLSDTGQGSFSIVKDRTVIDTKNVFAFPDNIEVDVFITLSSADPGREVATTAANGTDATLIQHHSFVRLPEDGYTPLPSDPRVGVVEETHYNYSAALDAPIETRFARRYRLEKDADGKVINPIVYYIDSGAPEPIRGALLEGARWWEKAFEAAGYPGGYRVEILPEDAHLLDIRYNVVQWVHRQTRGWSYGGGVSDPRTGEMLKGHVNLGSLRVRQDRMIFEGLIGTDKTGSGADDDPIELALDRIRQLSAHEVGHALGFAHNFAASTYDKGSVMDYPSPDIRVTNGQMDFSNAYGVGVGPWDEFTTTWLYGDLDAQARAALVKASIDDGLLYVADTNARSVGTGHPEGNVWDNRADPVTGLKDAMAVRALALANFGADRISEGQPISDLNKVIVPVYLYHRYQVAAASKVIGGMRFNYGLRGDGQPPAQIVSPAKQREALTEILKTLDAQALDIQDSTLNLLTPSVQSWGFADSDREWFRRTAYPAFDVTAAADTAADMTLDALLHPRRAARLVEFHRRDARNPSLDEVLRTIRIYVMSQSGTGRAGEIARTIQSRLAFALMELADSGASHAVDIRAISALGDMAVQAKSRGDDHGQWLAQQIDAYLERPREAVKAVESAKALPPGGPIGQGGFLGEDCWHCE